MIVQQRTRPVTACSIAIGTPVRIIHRIFMIKELVLIPYCTSLPNGHAESDANLKHWMPYGIPTIVIHHNRPITNQDNPVHHPPKINQIIFAKKLISILLILIFLSILQAVFSAEMKITNIIFYFNRLELTGKFLKSRSKISAMKWMYIANVKRKHIL